MIVAIPVDVKWYFIVVLFCFSLMTNNIEHLFVCVLAICVSSLGKCLFRSLANFKIELFVLASTAQLVGASSHRLSGPGFVL